MASPFLDLTLGFDQTTGLCDLVFDGVGFPFDATAATPLLISLGTERRADPDDVPPGTLSNADTYGGGTPSARRGTPLDALDAQGRFMGSRLWLLDDAKELPETRLDAIGYVTEATQWIDDLGVATAADASWISGTMLAILAQAGSMALRLPVSLV